MNYRKAISRNDQTDRHADGRRKAQSLSRAARDRLLRHSESVGRRQRALSAGPRLQGARDDLVGFRLVAGLPRQPRDARDGASHLRALVAATDVPVNADFEGGFAHDPAGVAESVTLAVETGVAGLSIEDSTGDTRETALRLETPRHECGRRARRSTRRAATRFLVGRAECFLVGGPISTR